MTLPQEGFTCIMMACDKGRTATVEALIARGVDATTLATVR